jgi:uncharacterized protein YcfL
MKKLFIVLAVASLGFVACNNEVETPYEETQAYKDSVAAAAAQAAADSIAKAAADSLNAVVPDSLPK